MRKNHRALPSRVITKEDVIVRHVCAHASGHLVAGYASGGWKIERVEFILDDRPVDNSSLAPPEHLGPIETAKSGLVISVAGATAEALFCGRFTKSAVAGDLAAALDHAKKLIQGTEPAEKLFPDIEHYKSRLVLIPFPRLDVSRETERLIRLGFGAAYALLDRWWPALECLTKLFADGFENARDAGSFEIDKACVESAIRSSMESTKGGKKILDGIQKERP